MVVGRLDSDGGRRITESFVGRLDTGGRKPLRALLTVELRAIVVGQPWRAPVGFLLLSFFVVVLSRSPCPDLEGHGVMGIHRHWWGSFAGKSW